MVGIIRSHSCCDGEHGVYWKPIYNVFEDFIRNIWIVNARHIKNVPGHKTDKNDSEWICQLLMEGLLKPNFIPLASSTSLVTLRVIGAS